MQFKRCLNKKSVTPELGFGIIELLVSISIVVIVTSVIMVRHSSYNGAVLLRSQTYQVALQARDVQLTAVSVVGQTGDFRNIFGLYFNTATPSFYYVFREGEVGNYFYDAGEAIGARSNLDPRFQIGEIRLVSGTGTTISTPDEVSIIFERPNFDARFYTNANTPAPDSASVVEIDIRLKDTVGSGVGEVRTMEISKTGQITVQ